MSEPVERVWSTRLASVLIAIVGTVVGRPAVADSKVSDQFTNGGITGWLRSYHTPVDHAPQYADEGLDKAIAHGWSLPASEGAQFQNEQVVVSKQQIKIRSKTPSADLSKDAEHLPTLGGYNGALTAEQQWDRRQVVGGPALMKVLYGSQEKINEECEAHMVPEGTIEEVTPQPSTDPIANIVARLSEGGWFTELDENGEPVWDTVPSIVLRLTSSVSTPASGVRTYSYVLENLSGIDREFDFPQITSASYSNGWSGVVEANDEVELQVVASEAYGVFCQNAQAYSNDDASGTHTNNAVFRVYVPGDRVAYSGTNTILSASYESGAGENVITFSVDQAAAKACLIRYDASGVTLVQEIDYPFVPATTYSLSDNSFSSGSNVYRVATGIGANYYLTGDEDAVEIEN